MGKSKSVEIGVRYMVAWHVVLAKRVDRLLEVRAGDKTAWKGSVAASTVISINQPMLFGGDKDQGGMVGNLAVMMGEAHQLPNAYLTSHFGERTVAWRGFTSLAWMGGEYGSNNPYPFKMSAKTFSCHEIWDEPPGWYPEKAEIVLAGATTSPANAELMALLGPTSGGWRYHYTAGTDPTPDFSAVDFDDSEWPVGTMPFGNLDDQPFVEGAGFPTELGTDGWPSPGTCWLRKRITLNGASTVAMQAFIDNAGSVWVDGELIDDDIGHTTIPGDFTIPHGGTVQIAIKAADVGTYAYAATKPVEFTSGGASAMNPVHVIVHAHTHSEMGRMPLESINDASARAAADWYYAKGFGIDPRHRVANESPSDFIQRIERVAGLSFTRDLATGQWFFYVANGEYDLESLPILTDDDIVSFKETPTIPDNAVNSVQVKYFDPERKETVSTPPLRALGLVDLYGEIQQVHDFPEIPTAAIASLVGWREALGSITPTRRFDLVAKPTGNARHINKGQYFRLQLPKRGIADMVCLMGDKSEGTLKSGNLDLTVAQDVYSLPDTVYSDVEHGVDTRPSQVPVAIVDQYAFEAPYIEVCTRLPRAELEVLPADVGFLSVVAADPARSRDFTLMVAPSGGEFVDSGDGDFCPTAIVNEAASKTATDFTLSAARLLASVSIGDPVLWGNELCRVDALDIEASTITLGRGCADTVPHIHAAGERLFFYRDGAAYDTSEHVDAEVVDIKLLTNTGSQRLDLALATPMSIAFDQRQFRPYPPGGFTINAEAYPAFAYGELSIGAAHRDRVLQADQLVDQTMAGIGPEADTTYTIRYYADNVLEHTESGITAFPSTYSPAGDCLLRIELEAVRDGLASWQAQVHELSYFLSDPDPITDETGSALLDQAADVLY